MMFKVFVNDGTQEMPTDDIFYIISKEGIFLKKKLGIMESIAPVDNISILESVSTMATMDIPQIPAASFAKVIEFFKSVYDKYWGEAIVLLFYNEETKKYRIIPPHQKVTAASLDYNRGITLEGWTMIGDIHSHGSMSAFHSGTDDDDEKTFDGLHITLGHMKDDDISISASIVSNGYRFMVEPNDYIAGIKLTRDIDEIKTSYTSKIYKWINGKMELDEKASKKTAYSYQKFDKRYISLVSPSKRQFNEKWMNNVEQGSYSYTYGGYSIGGGYLGRGGRYGHNQRWGQNYDAHAWNEKFHKVGAQTPIPFPANITNPLIPKNINPITFPPHDQTTDDTLPCLTCKHKEKMLEFIHEMEEDDEDAMYQCGKCKVIIGGDSEEIICPNCKTDTDLVKLEISKLEDHYKNDDFKVITPLDSIDLDAQLITESPDQEGFHSCIECGATFLLLKTDEHCPYCNTLLPENPDLIHPGSIDTSNQELAIAYQSTLDSGGYLDKEMLDVNKQALLDAAEEEDEGLEKIPDPSKDEIPISIKEKYSSSRSRQPKTIKQMFKSVFGKGKIGNS